MEQYANGLIPDEARLQLNSPSVRFRENETEYHHHTWRVTQVTVAITRRSRGSQFAAICLLDELDSGFREGLEKLMTKIDVTFPGPPEAVGVAEMLTEVLYIVAFSWGAMLTEAEKHIQLLVSACDLTFNVSFIMLMCVSERKVHQGPIEPAGEVGSYEGASSTNSFMDTNEAPHDRRS